MEEIHERALDEYPILSYHINVYKCKEYCQLVYN